MLETLKVRGEDLLRRLREARNPHIERWIGITILGASLLFLSLVLLRGWSQVKPYLQQIEPIYLLLGQLCTVIALALGAIVWGLVQRSFGLGFGWKESIAIHIASGITKYIPGYAWQYMSKGYLSRERGGTYGTIGYAILTEFVLLIAGGVAIAAGWGWAIGHPWEFAQSAPLWIWPATTIAAMLFTGGWILFSKRLATQRRWHYTAGHLWLAVLVAGAGWLLFAAAAWFMARSLYPVAPNDFPQYAVALIVSGIVSILVIIVPGGLGVRETALSVLLIGTVPLSVAIIISILVRLSIVIGEVVTFGIVWKVGVLDVSALYAGTSPAKQSTPQDYPENPIKPPSSPH